MNLVSEKLHANNFNYIFYFHSIQVFPQKLSHNQKKGEIKEIHLMALFCEYYLPQIFILHNKNNVITKYFFQLFQDQVQNNLLLVVVKAQKVLRRAWGSSTFSASSSTAMFPTIIHIYLLFIISASSVHSSHFCVEKMFTIFVFLFAYNPITCIISINEINTFLQGIKF